MITTTTTTPTTRPLIIGPASGPEPPFPHRMEGPVIKGFGRGSKELGIPTANLPVDAATAPWIADARSGVYFGWAALGLPASHPDSTTSASTSQEKEQKKSKFTLFPMVMSIGYNPFYRNETRSAEVHVLHAFGADFYGSPMRLLVCGFVRDERDYDGLEALVQDIRTDCDVARNSLARPAWTPSELGGQGEGTLDGSWLLREEEAGKVEA